MNKFNRLFVIGTKVQINGSWHMVKEIHASRKLITVSGLMGSFQRSDVQKFSNAR